MEFQPNQIAHWPAPLRLATFVGSLALLWLPLAGPIHHWIADANTANILSLVVLYAVFVALLWLWGRWVYQVPNLLRDYGWDVSWRSGQDYGFGFGVGFISLSVLFGVQWGLGWVQGRSLPAEWSAIVLQGLLVATAVGIAEELLFRGWLLEELQRDYSHRASQWASAVIFAMLHGFRVQFFALVLFGAALVWAKWASDSDQLRAFGSEPRRRWGRGRLALPMGLHAGLVWGVYLINVGELVTYTDRVPPWITGMSRNPLEGVLGVGFMGLLAWGLRSRSR
jgi:uncharacterized protein